MGVAINFAIDGLKDTNHIYRVKTDFDRIIDNAEAFIKAGGNAHWIMIIFDHNQHQIDEANELSKKVGFRSFQTKISSRGFNLSGKKTHNKISVPSDKKYQPSELKHGYIEKPVRCKAIYQEQFLTPDNMIMLLLSCTLKLNKKTYGVYKKEDDFYRFLIDNNIKHDLDKYEFDEIVESYRSNLNILKDYWDKKIIGICNRTCGSNRGNKTIKYV